MSTQATGHPHWCDETHRADPHAVHSHEVGRVTVSGQPLTVKVHKVEGGGSATALVKGRHIYIEVHRDDSEDFGELLAILGFPYLGELVKDAGRIAKLAPGKPV